MRRVLALILFAGLSGLLPRATSAQSVDLSFLVTEDSFQALVSELDLQGASLDDARAIWGPYFFNLTQAQVTYEAYLPWQNVRLPRYQELSGRFREYNADSVHWSLPRMESLYVREQRRLTDEYFDGMRRLAPYKAVLVDARQRSMRRRLSMSNKWNARQIIGSHADLIGLMESLSRANPDSALGRPHWSEDVQAILDAYERALDGLIVEFDNLYMYARYPDPPPPKTTDLDKLRQWYEKRTIVWPADYAKYLLPIRKLNQATTLTLAEALPDEEAAIFLKRANMLISPFAYRTLGWQYWIEKALEPDDLDDDLRGVLLAQQEIFERDHARHIENLVGLYEIRSKPEQFEKAQRYFEEVQEELRARDDRLTEEQLAFDAAVQAFEVFDREASAKIKSRLGMRADSISASVMADMEVQKHDLSIAQQSQSTRRRNEQHREDFRPRHSRPFINASEFNECVESIAFDDDERQAIFESLFMDFQDGFKSTRETYDENRRVARAKDILENPQPPRDRNSSTVIIVSGPSPSIEHTGKWNQRWIELRQGMERDFDEQVKLFLSEDEQVIWGQELRRLRRIRMIPGIKVYLQAGQKRYAYDVIETAGKLDLKASNEVKFSKLLYDYEIEFDAACRRFEDEYEAVLADAIPAIRAWQKSRTKKDADKSSRLTKKLKDIGEGILNVRLRFEPLLLESLDDGEQERFRAAIDAHEFPWLYLDSPYDLCRAALKRDQSLDDDQFLALDEQETQFEVVRNEFRRRYLALMRRYDKEKDKERRLAMIEDIYDMALRRTFIEQDACDDLLRLIPPHQREELALDIRMLLATFP